MTPSNPDNQQPLIYRIADALGVFHLVAPVNHTHLTTEVAGLTEALAAKANAAAVETALAGKMDNKTIDSTPTANSTNLVTSGGVKTALDGKMDNKTIDSTPTADSTNLVKSGGVKAALDGKMDNTALSLEVEYHMTSHQVNYYDGASSIFISVPENKIAVAMLSFFSNEGHNPLGNTLVQLRWYNSVNNIYKHIEIFINGAVYNLRYKVETEEWREMVQTAASITQYLPTSAE